MKYDIAIIGGGPGGLTAAIYAVRGGFKTVIIEKTGMGGQAALTSSIENYPGIPEITGYELGQKMAEQAEKIGAETIYDEVKEINFDTKIITTLYSGDISASAIILATGAVPRKLGIPGEDKFAGRGVSYCAVCDGAFFKQKTVAVVGGGNTALEDAIYLTRFASNVYIIHRRKEFRGSRILVEQMKKTQVTPVLDSVLTSIEGDGKVNQINVKNVVTGESDIIKADGVFIAIGRQPVTELAGKALSMDENGYIITDEEMRTSVDGVFAAGDLRKKTYRQIVTATSDGAIAALSAIHYINSRRS